ncbi:prolactin regulatory element-binding protein [Schistocerca gregaria]|uniref:prolactin regulatory element-binding protein n=1 Tax=Schistocerca gregaria TaxID=7010 RepID=UPI00211E9B8D|nr:prolactin regulatory element-binding protein [Schistocerca gregaria]
MSPNRRNKEGLLARVNFPLYVVKMITNHHILVAGGGGSSKTGVANGFEIFELSHDGEKYVAEEVIRHETGPSVVMNCASYNNGKRTFLVAGQESHCQLYTVNMKVEYENDGTVLKDHKNETVSSRKRSTDPHEKIQEIKPIKEQTDRNSNSFHRLIFDIKPNDSIQTDFGDDEPLQRVVRISLSGKLMATGGTDGHIRLWQFPSLRKHLDIAAHKKEIDDIDFSPDETMVLSVSKDGLAVIWSTQTGKKLSELKWNAPENVKYLYKRCRFGTTEGNSKNSCLFTLSNPFGKAGKLKSYLQKWDPAEASLKKSFEFDESLSALSVSDDGKFVAVGTMFSGSVHIHIAFSLQQVLNVQGVHNMFVTGLEFLPSDCLGGYETAVISISVDNRVCIHHVPFRSTIPLWLAVLLVVITLVLTFMLCSFLGL